MTDPTPLPSTNDPREWARAFLQTVTESPDALTEDGVVVWFTNALITGAEQAELQAGNAGRPGELRDDPAETWTEFWKPLFDADRPDNVESGTFRYEPAIEAAIKILTDEPSRAADVRRILTDDGLDFDQIQRELHDYSTALELVPNAYSSVTGGRISKLNTDPKYVLEFTEDRYHQNLVDIAARAAHEANRLLQLDQGDPAPSGHWYEAEGWQRLSAVEGVQQVIDGATAEELHEGWCRSKEADGWVYGEVKDGDAKTHPQLIPYDQLDPGQKLKDAMLRAIVLAVLDIAEYE